PEDLRQPKKQRTGEIILAATILGVVSTIFDFATFFIFKGQGEQALQTNWFMVSIFTELLLLFSIRAAGPFWKALRPSSSVIGLTAAAMIFTVAFPFSPVGQQLFHFVRPTPDQLTMVFLLAAGYFAANELLKKWVHKMRVPA
ncbi:cation transporting ATPase C-terminal domain-containing protein, partial [Candidatus Uhrbacteria bacterium]|nr:cation transporting ATPase C-terminal domain-containing protein [Candidatus Uhrbacteria bacterium]